jgi:hypothetical protein
MSLFQFGIFLLVTAAPSPARAASVLAVLSSDSGHYRQAYEGFQEEWGSSVPFVLAGASMRPAPAAVVSFGSRAGKIVWPGEVAQVVCLAPGVGAETSAASRIDLLPSPPVLISRMRRIFPGLKRLMVFWSTETMAPQVDDLIEAGADQGVDVSSERVLDPASLPAMLRDLKIRADALWLMPDPLLVNAVNFGILKEYSSAAQVPFFAPTEGLAEKGATATFAVPFREMGRAAALALKSKISGGKMSGLVYPDRIVVTLNRAAALRAGFHVDGTAGVDREVAP